MAVVSGRIGRIVLGKETGGFVVLCFLSSALARVWYTLAVNLDALFSIGDLVAGALSITAFVLPCSLCRLAVEVFAFTASRKIERLGGRLPTVVLAAAALLSGSLMLLIDSRNSLLSPISLVAAGSLCGVGYELIALLWYELFAAIEFEITKRLFLWRIGLDCLAALLCLAPKMFAVVACFLIPPLSALGFWHAQQFSGTLGPSGRQKPWASFKPCGHWRLGLGIVTLAMGFAFMQSAFYESSPSLVGTLPPLVAGALAGRLLTFVSMAGGMRAIRGARFDRLFKLGTLVSLFGFLALLLPLEHAFFIYCTATVAGAFIIEYTVALMTIFAAPHYDVNPLRVVSWGQLIMRSAGLPILLLGTTLAPHISVNPITPMLTYSVVAGIAVIAVAGMFLIDERSVDAFLWGAGTDDRKGGRHRGISNNARRFAAMCDMTEREAEVLQLLLEGRSAPFISDTLFISENTTKTHIRHIYQKAGVNSKQELIDRSQEQH